jgi:PAS domain S-box-containing protein
MSSNHSAEGMASPIVARPHDAATPGDDGRPSSSVVIEVRTYDGIVERLVADPLESGALAASVRALLQIRNNDDAQRLSRMLVAEGPERFREVTENINDVFWIFEPQTRRFLYVSDAYGRIWRRDTDALYADAKEWLGHVHADDRGIVQEAFDRLATNETYAVEYRAMFGTGEHRWIAERTFPVAQQGSQLPRIVGVSQDITARKTGELELLQADRRKNEFLAMVAHELRSPLEPIRSAAAVLAREHVDGPATRRWAVAVIERQMLHLTRLIEDLLDVSRINHGKMRLHTDVVRLADVVDAAVDANRPLINNARLQLNVVQPQDVWVLGDAVRLTQVFSNLLHNATKFSVAGGTIEVCVCPSAGDSHVFVSVRDDGVGIAAGSIDAIFDLFTQAEHGPERGGLGIGLSVVKSLTEMHGGTVSVHSEGVGEGCEFIVTLPTTIAPAARAADSAASPTTRRRILVVDDDHDAAETMQVLLELEGHQVELAHTGESALQRFAVLDPDVVILDIGLPDISGCDVARRLRAGAPSASPLLIALTGHGHEEAGDDVRAAGFDHHLVKPADPAQLMSILTTARRSPRTERNGATVGS